MEGGKIMANINEIKEVYLAIGVGGISFIMLVYVLWYYITKITPLLNQINQRLLLLKLKNR